jgi:hypothetical protein
MASLGQNTSVAEQLNRTCYCVTLDAVALADSLRDESGDAEFYSHLIETRPHLFAQTPVFLPRVDLDAMGSIVRAIEGATELPLFRDAVRAWAPPIALVDHGPHGVFMGYDFHLGSGGPKLIEINTNAGGAFLNALLARAQVACCAAVEQALVRPPLAAFDNRVVAMFEAEWRSQGRIGPLRSVAIIDDAPQDQFLHPEFILAKRLLERHGIQAIIADPGELHLEAGVLSAGAGQIDLVYNRLVDFALTEPGHAVLRAAYVSDAVVLTPNPHNHAFSADKRNLTLLSDIATLKAWGLADAAALSGIPRAVRVSPLNVDALWAERKRHFFKPATGHAGKAVYRGDKLTKGVWAEISGGDYVAQEIAPPSERTIELNGERVQRKLDVRLYTYAGETLLTAARLYQGQTTNFRTEGGGFAPVFFV